MNDDGSTELGQVIRKIQSGDDLAAAVAAPEAILHVDVDWSGTARKSRVVIAALCDALAADERLSRVALYRIDCSPGEGPLYDVFGNWLEAQSGEHRLCFHGNGGLIWIRSGLAADSVDCAGSFTLAQLVSRTRALLDG